MQAIREIRTVEQGQVTLCLPHGLWGQQVEIIILPVQRQDAHSFPKKSLRGCLQQHVRSGLIDVEQHAWPEAAREKHVLR